METDFLNFRDGEYFNTNIYQTDLLDDSQSSLLDVMGDDYSGHNSEYDHAIMWEQDMERELNGDIALIPMSGYIDSIPKLSNSPPSKDFHRMFTDLQDHLPSIDHTDELDLRISDHNLTVDMFECLPPIKSERKAVPGGKNLALLKAVVAKEMSGDLDGDNFDIASYVNGDRVKAEPTSSEDDETSSDEDVPPPKFLKSSAHQEIKIKVENDSDDDCIDIETVSDQMPVLEARDLTSLLEQFEASEAVNPKKEEDEVAEVKSERSPEKVPDKVPDKSPDKLPDRSPDKSPDKYKKVEVKRLPDTISDELIQKLKASGLKKQISVIPAIPKRTKAKTKPKSVKVVRPKVPVVAKAVDVGVKRLSVDPSDDSSVSDASTDVVSVKSEDCANVQFDHDYCRVPASEDRIKCAILKQKLNIVKSDGFNRKPSDTKMVSLLKCNRNVSDQTPTQESALKQEAKKRKLNLEEYKKLRGEVIKSRSSDSSRAASPVNATENNEDKVRTHQELMMKMASEILKTPAKSRTTSDLTLEVFVPPDAVKPKVEVKSEPVEDPAPPARSEEFEMKTIISIGVNTIETSTDSVIRRKKLTELTPILQNASGKINSNSLITNITATLLQHKPDAVGAEDAPEHGEDKTVIVLYKNRARPTTCDAETQTEPVDTTRSNSASSTHSSYGRRQSYRTSSANSVSSSVGSRYSRSRSRSDSVSSNSSFSSSSSCSRSRSASPSRRYDRRHQYNRSRRRSRSNSYKRSRSPYQSSRRRRSRDSSERERQREVEERRVIYVGNIENGMTKAELRRRFQRFGPITNVSVHFRDHGDNYGFVTFAYKVDAYEAVENGNDNPELPKYDISFGGRRAFCKTRYSDLDNIETDASTTMLYRKEEDTFDILLREVQAKLLRKKKV